MLIASYCMIFLKTYKHTKNNSIDNAYMKTICLTLMLGIIIGIIGVGGGFLIIPVLVMFLKMEMKHAIATSLFIIAINSIVGFIADRQYLDNSNYQQIEWIISLSVIGMFVGIYLSRKFSGELLKKIFSLLSWLRYVIDRNILDTLVMIGYLSCSRFLKYYK